jgi:hypothetical protein
MSDMSLVHADRDDSLTHLFLGDLPSMAAGHQAGDHAAGAAAAAPAQELVSWLVQDGRARSSYG